MTAASKNHHYHLPSTSRPPKNPNPNSTATASTSFQNPNINPTSNTSFTTTTTTTTTTTNTPPPIYLSQQDQFLSRATHLTRHELLKRRSFNLKQLSKCYRDHYWALMEELKIQYREYYWKYGVSPFKEDHNHPSSQQQKADHGVEKESGGNVVNIEVIGENNNIDNSGVKGGDLDLKSNNNNTGSSNNNNRCLFVGCKLKAMALTSFCHLHILSDAKQKLYKPCGYVIKSAQAGPITCGKPILRSSAPSLCNVHFQKAQKHVTRALKKAGLNVSSSSKLAPKFHIIVAEYVRQIQAKRKAAAKRANGVKAQDKEASGS